MKKNQEYNLKKAINQLPSFKAPNKIWNGIEKALDKNNESLCKAIDDLPSFKAPDKIWSGIEKKLEEQSRKKVLLIPKPFLQIAASIIIIFSIGYLATYYFRNSDKDVTYSIEIIENEMEVDFYPAVDFESTNIISSNCQKVPEVCESPIFIELQSQLKELKNEQEKLESMLKNESNPQLLKFYYRIENERVDIEKKLVKMFVES